MQTHLNSVANWLQSMQQEICQQLEAIDGKTTFSQENWQQQTCDNNSLSGFGITRIIENGSVFSKGGVNFSQVKGGKLPQSATNKRPELRGTSFEAVGLSVVIHPLNPFVPTSHMNVRLLLANLAQSNSLWWFGGGFDLTPYYPFMEDCVLWHKYAHQACKPFGDWVYPQFKQNCDDYFYLPHRQETRGIGGIFFDDLNCFDFEICFSFIKEVAHAYLKAYSELITRRKDTPFDEQHLKFQQFRRGRYAEFNLLYDRGTLFGLQSGGKVEAILMSLPPIVRWDYNYHSPQNSPEAELSQFLQPRNWI